ncbi:hypothetical protein V8G54_036332 [Vigna mungo]|uniref:AB hydrolase-1 domain-containing protein n=1 Tax=Vigna mungo TaxID=3915 RepID=A0AAQ3MHG8_VIGMU
MVWRDQVLDFVTEIVKEPTILVGNSLGGFTALVVAIGLPELVNRVALRNSAGQCGDEKRESKTSEETTLQKFVLKPLKEVFQRVVLGFFVLAGKATNSHFVSSKKCVYKFFCDFGYNSVILFCKCDVPVMSRYFTNFT